MDRIFDKKGGIRVLTNGEYTREKLITDAACMALTAFNDKWKIT
jgi:non-canonical (house-cleaning) NTP pyrophosphatase